MPYTEQDIKAILERLASLEARVEEQEAELSRLRDRKVLDVERIVVGTDRNRLYLSEQGIRMGCGRLDLDEEGSIRLWRGGQPQPDVVIDQQGVTLYEEAGLTVQTQHGPLIELNPPQGWLRVTDPRGNGTVELAPEGVTVQSGAESATLSAGQLALERQGHSSDDYLRLSRGAVAGAVPTMQSWPGTPRFQLRGCGLLLETRVDEGGAVWRPWHADLHPRRLTFWEREEPVGHTP